MTPEEHSGFELQEEIKRYTLRISREISSKKKRKEVAREYSEHIEDAVYSRLMRGEDEKQAFAAACDELGDSTKIQEMLAVVHNKDRLPVYIKYAAIALVAVSLFSSYYFIEDRTYRSWLSFAVTLTAITASVYLVCLAFRYVRAFLIRRKSIRRLKVYAKDNGLRFLVNSNIYKSVFKKTDTPELIIESEKTRYIVSLWASIGSTTMLRLLDCGLYMYSKRSGFVFYTGHRRYYSYLARPKGFEMFPLLLASLENIPRGMSLFPKISWQAYESSEKKNINILLLNPVPLSVDAVKNGMLCKMNDGSDFLNMKIYDESRCIFMIQKIK